MFVRLEDEVLYDPYAVALLQFSKSIRVASCIEEYELFISRVIKTAGSVIPVVRDGVSWGGTLV
jgi:hypothetical protein